jgi:hypothetical protein
MTAHRYESPKQTHQEIQANEEGYHAADGNMDEGKGELKQNGDLTRTHDDLVGDQE